MEKKTAKERFEYMKPKPENESPKRTWLYIFIGIVLIFGLTYLFQEFNDAPSETIDPSSFQQLDNEVQEMKETILELEQRVEDLEA